MEGIRSLFRWRSERFSLWRYGPFAVMLGGPAANVATAWLPFWALSLLLQSRLMDDFLSRENDSIAYPDRTSGTLEAPSSILLVVINALPLLGNGWGLAFYGLFLLFQWPIFPAFAKYAGLVLLIDFAAGADPQNILWHVVLVGAAAAAFEVGHDPFREAKSRWLYGCLILLCIPLILGFCRLHPALEKTSQRRFLSAALPHLGAALVATYFFHR